MRALADAWPDRQNAHQLRAEIPWKYNCLLLDRVKDRKMSSPEHHPRGAGAIEPGCVRRPNVLEYPPAWWKAKEFDHMGSARRKNALAKFLRPRDASHPNPRDQRHQFVTR
jgi:hypothetical protein